MTDRLVVVEVAALERLHRAVIDHQRRARTSDPAVLRTLTELLTGASPRREWFSIREAAATLGVSERTVRRRVSDGTLRSRRVGRRVLVDVVADSSGQERSGADMRLAAVDVAG